KDRRDRNKYKVSNFVSYPYEDSRSTHTKASENMYIENEVAHTDYPSPWEVRRSSGSKASSYSLESFDINTTEFMAEVETHLVSPSTNTNQTLKASTRVPHLNNESHKADLYEDAPNFVIYDETEKSSSTSYGNISQNADYNAKLQKPPLRLWSHNCYSAMLSNKAPDVEITMEQNDPRGDSIEIPVNNYVNIGATGLDISGLGCELVLGSTAILSLLGIDLFKTSSDSHVKPLGLFKK
ncbi:hypothetical protein SK128_007878, partial [Halocaridina rubra]